MSQGFSNFQKNALPLPKRVATVCGEKTQVAQALRRQLQAWEGSHGEREKIPVGTGNAQLDRLLPGGGLARGTLVEWLAKEEGGGAGLLALLAAREACYEGGALVVCDRGEWFYPPAAAALGIDLEQVVLVRPENQADELWVIEQALRCPAVVAVWAWLPALPGKEGRRLQLAAESSGALGLLVRNERERHEPTWASAQWKVAPQPSGDGRRWRVELAKARGGETGAVVMVELDEVTGVLRTVSGNHETHPLSLVSSLAVAAGGCGEARTAR